MTPTPAFLPKTNIAAVWGSKRARHLHAYLDRTNAPMTKNMMSGAAAPTGVVGRTAAIQVQAVGRRA